MSSRSAARTANGMVLNDTGNLNLVKFTTITNSTIVGQPVGHIAVAHRNNDTILTPTRDLANPTRNFVTVVGNLRQIGPLSLSGDVH